MSKYLFLFSIGPVQAFIMQARKTQDLYAGSYLLSRLCEEGLKTFTKEKGKLIFPNITGECPDSLPNRFLGEIEIDEAREVGTKVEEAVRKKLKSLINKGIVEKIEALELYNSESHNTAGNKQIDSLLEINWCFYPLEEGYEKTYKNIERELGSLKNVRDFKQLEEQGRKCDVCGERNTLIYKKSDSDKKFENSDNIKELKELKDKKFMNDLVSIYENNSVSVPNSELKAGEGLCAVCFLKRIFKDSKSSFDKKFPSTSEIAFYPSTRNLGSIPEDLDYRLIYDIKNGNVEDKDLYENFGNTKEFYESNIKGKNLKISPYYAIVLFDGDSMGKWLGGQKLKEGKDLKEFHKEVSKILADYAVEAKNYIENNNQRYGRVVYAGGDDFLGFVALDKIGEVMKHLRSLYDSAITEKLKDYIKDGENGFSFSAGIVIAHNKSPLSYVLDWARVSEKKAKDIKEKDGFCITLLKHSGEIVQSCYKWKYEGNTNNNILNVFQELYLSVLRGDIASGFISKLVDIIEKIVDSKDSDSKPEILPIIKLEIHRLLKKEEDTQKDKIKDIEEKLNILLNNSNKGNKDWLMVNEFKNLLLVIKFLTRQ